MLDLEYNDYFSNVIIIDNDKKKSHVINNFSDILNFK